MLDAPCGLDAMALDSWYISRLTRLRRRLRDIAWFMSSREEAREESEGLYRRLDDMKGKGGRGLREENNVGENRRKKEENQRLEPKKVGRNK